MRNEPHTHKKPTLDIREPAIRCMKKLARKFCNPPGEIMNYAFRKYEKAALVMNPTAATQLIQKEREKHILKTPKTLAELANILSDTPLARNCYDGHFVDEDGKYGLVFSNDAMMDVLRENCSEIYVDGTFNVSYNILLQRITYLV
ncbi:hypothetical protein PV327_011178 [Microctonus hyperodae]|uniref:Uncharacterized protein n=1 Tax=Microctonus hyperodae TaxID=165561 RepID=A0AA39FL68_MICHY|nr:hypothetical protein PV327_011178 [Microctonus hyperodae]